MLPQEIRKRLKLRIEASGHPRECAVDVMYALQDHYGYLGDDAVEEASELLGMTPLEIDELATFYDFIYREPVGRYVIHVCDSVVCWMHGQPSIMEYLCNRLGVEPGGTTADGLFTVLPASCLGFCDHAPAMLINGKLYGRLTPESIDAVLESLKIERPPARMIR